MIGADPVRRNRRTLLLLPLYAAAALVARVLPRNRALWVFGRKAGVGDGPWALLEEVLAADDGVRVVWLAQDARQLADARARGVEAYLIASWRGRWCTLRAGVLVLAYGLGDVWRPGTAGAHVVQTWHGSPLKRIHLDEVTMTDVGATPLARAAARVLALAVKRSGRMIGTVPVGSPVVAERFRSAWRWPDLERVALVGDPRCDRLHRSDPASHAAAREALAERWQANLPPRLVLYAPTWRDGAEGPRLLPADLDALAPVLEETDAWLVLRAHPLGSAVAAGPAAAGGRLRYLSPEDVHDLNAVLEAFDVLVTDYSAAAIDYAALLRPQVFYAPDVAEYSAGRGLYEDYATFTGGCWAHRWDEVGAELSRVLGDDVAYESNVARTSTQLRDRYHQHRDGRAAQRLYCEVRARVGLSPATGPA